MITKNAYAKVNLSLDITGKRDDGYHLVRMVMQSLDISDILTFESFESDDKSEDSRIEIQLLDKRHKDKIQLSDSSQIESSGNDSDLGTLPLGPDNLIFKVAHHLMETYVWPRNPKAGVRITLEKNIPIAAGLAGGSSDAAATFKGINELFELGIHDKELMEMGVVFGADIPYCIMGSTALSEGIGEKLTRLPDIPYAYFLVAKPNISVSTGEAYGGYDSLAETFTGNVILNRSTGKKYITNKSSRMELPDVDGQVDAIYAGSLTGITDRMSNVLEAVTSENHPEIKELEEIMKQAGALNAIMSGSGPTVYGIFRDEEAAKKAAEIVEETGYIEQLFVVKPV